MKERHDEIRKKYGELILLKHSVSHPHTIIRFPPVVLGYMSFNLFCNPLSCLFTFLSINVQKACNIKNKRDIILAVIFSCAFSYGECYVLID